MIELTASPGAQNYCERFRREFKNTLTDTERNATPDENFQAKVAEMEVGRFLHMRWSDLEPLLNSTSDHDIIAPHGLLGDLKTSSAKNGTLFWPRDKWEDFHARRFDWLGFCSTHRFPVIEFRGFVLKREFELQHEVAGAGHRFMERTRYWPDKPLRDPELLLHPVYWNDHACSVCGSPDVAHGKGRATGPIHEIEWRCKEHW